MIKVTFQKPAKPNVIIEMPYEVAQTILRVCARVAGSSKETRRKHTDELAAALNGAGVIDEPMHDLEGSVTFK